MECKICSPLLGIPNGYENNREVTRCYLQCGRPTNAKIGPTDRPSWDHPRYVSGHAITKLKWEMAGFFHSMRLKVYTLIEDLKGMGEKKK